MHTSTTLFLTLVVLMSACVACNTSDPIRSDTPTPNTTPTAHTTPTQPQTSAPTSWPTQNTPLAQAHEAFLKQDYRAMVRHLHALLIDPTTDLSTRTRAIELLEVAYDDTQGRLPAAWSLPSGVERMTFEHIRKSEPDQLSFRSNLRIWSQTKTRIQRVTIRDTLRGEIVLDAESHGVSTLRGDNEGLWEFELEGHEQTSPLAEGVYTLILALDDGTKTVGWFIASNLTSSATPTIRSPNAGQTLTTSNPVLRWEPFWSPEHRSFEARSMGVWVSSLEDEREPWFWFSKVHDPPIQNLVLGQDTRIRNGRYWLALTFRERRSFGPIALERISRAALPFSLDAQP